MSQYPGGQPPPGGPYYGQPPYEPYAPSPPPQGDPYFGPPPVGDPYAPPQYPQDPYYGPPGYPPQGGYPQPGQGWPPGYPPQGYWQPPPPPPQAERRSGSGAAIVGIFLVLVGVWFLFREEIGLDFGRVWPIVAVSLGVLMVLAAFIPRRRG